MSEPLRLADIEPLEGGRQYVIDHWMTDEHKAMIAPESSWENKEAWLGDKHDFYAGYGKCIQPKSIFEVGVFMGYSIATMIWGAGGSVEMVCLVDISEQIKETTVELMRQFPNLNIIWNHVDSKNIQIARAWPEGEFDIVHIDGDHTYEYAHSDLFNFGPMVSKNGLIVVDDAKDPAVLRACEEFKSEYDMDSRFIDSWNGNYLLMRKP